MCLLFLNVKYTYKSVEQFWQKTFRRLFIIHVAYFILCQNFIILISFVQPTILDDLLINNSSHVKIKCEGT